MFEFVPQESRAEWMEWFMDKDTDTTLDRRFKNGLEDMMIGAGAETVFTMFRAMKALKGSIQNKPSASQSVHAMNELLDGGKGTNVRQYVDQRVMSSAIVPDISLNTTKADYLDAFDKAKVGMGEIHRLEQLVKDIPDTRRFRIDRRRATKKLKLAKRMVSEETQRIYKYVPDTSWDEINVGSDLFRTGTGDVSKPMTKQEFIKQVEGQKVQVNGIKEQKDSVLEALDTNPLLKDAVGADELIDAFSKVNPKSSSTRNSVKMTSTGDEGIEGFVNVMEQLTKAQGYKKTKTPIAEQFANITKTLQDEPNGELAMAIKRFVDDNGINEGKLISTMSMADVNLQLMPVMIRSLSDFRRTRGLQWKRLAGTLIKKEVRTAEDYAKFFGLGRKVDTMDILLDKNASGLSKGLRAMGSMNNDALGNMIAGIGYDISKHADGKAVSNPLVDDVLKQMDSEDIAKLDEAILKVANAEDGELLSRGSKGFIDDPQYSDLVFAQAVGQMIGSFRSLGNVFIGTATMSIFKNVLMKSWEAFINTPLRWTRYDTGARIMPEVSEKLGVLFDVSGDYLDALVHWDSSRLAKSIGLDSADYSNNMTHKTMGQVFENIDKAIKRTELGVVDKAGKVVQDPRPRMALAQKLTKLPLGISIISANLVIRRMEEFDGLFRRFGIQSEARSLASRMWHREGGSTLFSDTMSRSQFTDRVADLTNEHLLNLKKLEDGAIDQIGYAKLTDDLFEGREGLLNEVDRIAKSSNQDALETTFQETTSDTVFGQAFGQAGRMAQDSIAGKAGLVMTFPFRKSPVNAFRSIGEHSPFAPLSSRWRARLMSKDPDEVLKAVASMTAGSALLLGLTQVGLEGRITGSLNHETWAETHGKGAQPYSILLGDKWYSYAKWSIAKPALASVADYINMNSDTDADNDLHITHMLGLFMQNSFDESNMTILAELAEVLKRDNVSKAMADLAVDKVTMFFKPAHGLTSSLSDLMNNETFDSEIERESESMYTEFQRMLVNDYKNYLQVIPTDKKPLLIRKVDIFGEPVEKHANTRLHWMLNAIGQKNNQPDLSRAKSELMRLGLMASQDQPKDVYGVTMTDEEYRRYKKYVWQGSKGLLYEMEEVVTENSWADRDKDTQLSILQGMITAKQNEVKDLMTSQEKSLSDRVAMEEVTTSIKGRTKVDTKSMTALEHYIEANGSRQVVEEAKELEKAFNLGQ